MTIIGDGTAYCQAIAKRGYRISICPVLQGSLDGSHSPNRLFEFLFGVLIGLDKGFAGLAETSETGTIDEGQWARLL